MNSIELKELLVDVIAPISAIERKTGIPKNVLQQSLKGKRTLPKEWVIRLQEFVEKKQYIGLRRKPRNVPKKGTVIKDIVKNLQELPPITNLSTLKDFNNTNEIPRLEGEGSLDYRIRCAELNARIEKK